MTNASRITYTRLRELLNYDPETGRLSWRVSRSNIRSGMEAGTITRGRNCVYLIVSIDGYRYKAHRLIWLYVTGKWPSVNIDHIDGKGSNNHFTNLRLATTAENLRNAQLSRRNTSGFKGVSYNRRLDRWQASITVAGKLHYLGIFNAPEKAHVAYCTAAKQHFGEFARFE